MSGREYIPRWFRRRLKRTGESTLTASEVAANLRPGALGHVHNKQASGASDTSLASTTKGTVSRGES